MLFSKSLKTAFEIPGLTAVPFNLHPFISHYLIYNHLRIRSNFPFLSLHQNFNLNAMAQNQINSVVATTSGICGGVGKALSANLILLNITFQSILEVAVYAAVSALVGYGVKKGIDHLVTYFKQRK